ncbi:hypothetical protein CIL05_07405 [Virgibacillus profundi]|uniref:Uncharacterized protein n=1 Tax=Virgibacillus profundi TaxID=2024555 RepID=A0A2A2IF58_9BACI|nr:hypothetical protein [Virgibacillus profundi]PAV30287.1 hypothetical protein CIL05_07405 [Virgibacillus profundi]PXY54459.1 hypothetical protein CIT14_07490 [Virgibacillus profundi]
MDKTIKRIIITLATILLLSGVFAVGAYASATWLSFEGDEKVSNTESNIDEIMDILRQVNEDKLSAEEALEELEDMNPPGLVEQIKELEEQIEVLKDEKQVLVDENEALNEYVEHLETELTRANEKVDGLSGRSEDAVEEAREIVGE